MKTGVTLSVQDCGLGGPSNFQAQVVRFSFLIVFAPGLQGNAVGLE
jgi:hypothetical protein